MLQARKKLFLFWGICVLLIAIVITIVVVQVQQKTGSHAANQTAIPASVCGTNPLDVMLIIDRSGSMNDKTGTQGLTKLQGAISAAQQFVDILSADSAANRIGLVSFSTTASLDSGLSTNSAAIKTKIGQLTANGNTCDQCAIQKANQEIHTNGRANAQKVVVLLTDGIANEIVGQTNTVSTTTAEQDTLIETQSGFTTDKTNYFTIGLGNDVNTAFLQKIATTTNAQYYFSPTTDQLTQIYKSISQIIGKGSIAGTVFNDVNNNGVFDAGEQNLSGWQINVAVGMPTAQPVFSFTTASTSGYSFNGLCDGTYYVSETAQSGWTQTTPTNPTYYTVSVSSGGAVISKDFGNVQRACGVACVDDTSCNGASNGCTVCNPTTKKCSVPSTPTPTPTITPTPTCSPEPPQCQPGSSLEIACPAIPAGGWCPITPTLSPTPTPLPNTTQLSITAFLHNIGSSGDNANPTNGTLSNKNPLHPTRGVQAFVYDSNNILVASPTGSLVYSSASGSFKGTVDLGTNFPSGKYIVKIQSDYHLRRLIPGIQTITAGTTNTLPSVSLVAGDADKDNNLSILDYNLFLGCYAPTGKAKSCTDAQKTATDFNDDGKVDEIDYNLFIRELSVQNGD